MSKPGQPQQTRLTASEMTVLASGGLTEIVSIIDENFEDLLDTLEGELKSAAENGGYYLEINPMYHLSKMLKGVKLKLNLRYSRIFTLFHDLLVAEYTQRGFNVETIAGSYEEITLKISW